jgi:hypothetical protein
VNLAERTSWQSRKLLLNDLKLGFDCSNIGARLIRVARR